nr:hypothetical protein [uncultured Brevundimonas sp.]
MAWRALFPGLVGDRRARPEDVTSDPFARPDADQAPESDDLSLALDEIEAAALDIYASNGLPRQPGHYRLAPNETEWRFIGADLTPEARFSLTLEHPSEQGWRFARLQDLGARSDRADLREASRLLNDIAMFRKARRGVLTQDHLLMAMELGGAWRALRDAEAVRTSKLNLSVPGNIRARRDKPISEA